MLKYCDLDSKYCTINHSTFREAWPRLENTTAEHKKGAEVTTIQIHPLSLAGMQ
jgi:hypothetical protein